VGLKEAMVVFCGIVGAVFFAAGTLGLLRFPDVYTRLHALTKADGLGLGFTALAVALWAGTWSMALKAILIWGLTMLAGATVCKLLAQASLRRGVEPWRK
jgi:multicomponent Na+:H+ antiporter subunit G